MVNEGMKLFKWVVKKINAIKEKKQTKKMSIFFKTRLKLDRSSSIGEQPILGRKDYTTRKIDGDGKSDEKTS